MDNCFIDVALEFFGVAFHNLLYYTSIYPENIFETRRKYSIVVYRCIHPKVNQYIDLCLKSAGECLKKEQLSRIEFAITDKSYKPILKFNFDLDKCFEFDETMDAYLVQCEQNMRAVCLKLSCLSNKIKELPEDCSFSIYLHTNESTAVALANNPNLERFPLVEVDKHEEADQIIPLRRFSLRSYNIDAYFECLDKVNKQSYF